MKLQFPFSKNVEVNEMVFDYEQKIFKTVKSAIRYLFSATL